MRLLLFLVCGLSLFAQPKYEKPPKEVLDVLNARSTPSISVSPSRTHAALLTIERNPPISELARPMLRIAGLRIDPENNGQHATPYATSVTILDLASGAQMPVALPAGAKGESLAWSPDGKHFALANATDRSIDLWVGETATAKIRKIDGVKLNAATGEPLQWLADNHTLLIRMVPAGRGKAPEEPRIPVGPHVQESSGRAGPVRTYEDMLSSPHDEDLFDYYATAQLAYVDVAGGKVTPVGHPAILPPSGFGAGPKPVQVSPDGAYLLVTRVHRPYSYLHPATDFPREVEVWDKKGAVAYKVASLPLADRVPIEGVPTGPRAVQWRASGGASLVWAEAMDGGNPKEKAQHRDRIVTLQAPFRDQPKQLFQTEERFTGLQMSDGSSLAFVSDYERNKRWQRIFQVDLDKAGDSGKLVFSRNIQDRYKDPGQPVMKTLPNGESAMLRNGDFIFLRGTGSTPSGDRPFLDRFNLATQKSERLFQCDENSYEHVIAVLDDNGDKLLTERESPTEPPNFFVRTSAGAKALTKFTDPTPQLRGIRKELVTYTRPDGVPLSFTLYLPPGYQAGTRLPTVVWAYPREYNDAATAGQVSGSTKRFTTFAGPTHLYFLLRGYAILDDAAMPVVGTPETVNNTYLEQIVADAKAAIDKAASMGVTDPNRVGVGGHSYGAFMTANLLAHSNLFRAGIARSGAYNRTLTPFGFQTERRTIWEAPEVYLQMSPFLSANRIKTPILLIHGEADNNTGTFPIQSERMYQAIRGNGGTVRYVTLPFESHGYAGKETIEHVLWEMISWFDRYVKDAPPAATAE